MNRVLKGAMILSAIGIFIVSSAVVACFGGEFRRKWGPILISAFAKLLARIVGLRIQLYGRRYLEVDHGALLVANHLGFWDVVVISAVLPVRFITSVEVRDAPVLGWITRAAGCIFVERRNSSRLKRLNDEVSMVAAELARGSTICLFPEGTSSNGDTVLPFKRLFFNSALIAGKPVIPVCISYETIDGEDVNETNRDRLYYYGNHRFWDQLKAAFAIRQVNVTVDVCGVLNRGLGSPTNSDVSLKCHELILRSYTGYKEVKHGSLPPEKEF